MPKKHLFCVIAALFVDHVFEWNIQQESRASNRLEDLHHDLLPQDALLIPTIGVLNAVNAAIMHTTAARDKIVMVDVAAVQGKVFFCCTLRALLRN